MCLVAFAVCLEEDAEGRPLLRLVSEFRNLAIRLLGRVVGLTLFEEPLMLLNPLCGFGLVFKPAEVSRSVAWPGHLQAPIT